VENPVRTQQFLSVMAERKSALEASLAQIFPRPSHFVCEFGCGHGHFLVAYALAHPEKLCLGLDIEHARIERANLKQARVRSKAPHLHFLQADANLFLDTLPAGVTLSDSFILFPDPWPKKRHHKNRLIQPAFLDKLHARAIPATRIFFRTDHEPYFEAARATFVRHAGWEITDDAWPFEHETVFQSRAASPRSLVARRRA
jgi:tRNA (guanine-N7-)-methyltransferase